MKNLVIIGTGGFGRELYYGAKKGGSGYGEEWNIKGFIKDPTYKEIEDFETYCPEGIIGTIDDYEVRQDDVFFCAVGDFDLKKEFIRKIKARGGKFMNIIHRTAFILDHVTFGEGVSVGPYATISCNVKIGDFSSVGYCAAVGHDVDIENYVHIASFAHIGGFCSIKSGTTIEPHSIILPKVSIAEDTHVGAGSLILRSIKKPNQTWFGSPAKRLT